MWRKALSWIALAANGFAVLFDIGLMVYVVYARPAGVPVTTMVIGSTILGLFFLSGPVITIFALLVGSPILRPNQAPLIAGAFD